MPLIDFYLEVMFFILSNMRDEYSCFVYNPTCLEIKISHRQPAISRIVEGDKMFENR